MAAEPRRLQRPRTACAAIPGWAQLLEIFPVVPLVGNQTLNVGVLSYAGQLNLTAVADGDACPDIDVFAQGVRNTLRQLARSVVATT
jgi:hypothetical protein